MRIVVSGAGFKGKGAEAMLRTVQSEVLSRIPDVEFCLWRGRPLERRLALDAGFTPLFWPGQDGGLSTRLLQRLHLHSRVWSARQLGPAQAAQALVAAVGEEDLLADAYGRYLERSGLAIDAMIDVSGFAYGDAWGAARAAWNRALSAYCVKHNVPMVFMPQAWGTFEEPETRDAVLRMLGVPNLVLYARDHQSARHLGDLLACPSTEIDVRPDIAFAFRGGSREQGEQLLHGMGCGLRNPIVGIAPNTQVSRRVAGRGGGNPYVQTLVGLVKHCIDVHGADVVLQASEMDPCGGEIDDRHLCALIAAAVNRPDRCFATPVALSAGQTAAMIGRLDFIISSRFHSLVFALSQGVPGMVISWSHKYAEVMSLFGLESSVIEFLDLDLDRATTIFDEEYGRRLVLSRHILGVAETLRGDVAGLFDSVAATLSASLRSPHA